MDNRQKKKAMRNYLVAIALFASLGASAQSSVQKSMLDTFVKYASIDSQSNYDSICTQGQYQMALVLQADVKEAVAKSKVAGVRVQLS